MDDDGRLLLEPALFNWRLPPCAPQPPQPAAPQPLPDTQPEANLAFAVVPIPGKGMGCRATRDIQQGERLYAESPLVRQGPGAILLRTAVEALSPADRLKFFGLTQNEERFGDKLTAEGILATNAHPCHEFMVTHRGIFPTIARFNHSCESSAVYRYNSNLEKLTVHAIRRIGKGEEITVTCARKSGSNLPSACR